MKKIITIWIASATLLTSQAQLLTPQSMGGAMLGGLIGGVVNGSSCNGFSGNGAAVGAGIGLLAGSLAGEASRYSSYKEQSAYSSAAPSVNLGYGYGSSSSSAYIYGSPNNYLAPGNYYRPTRPNYVVSGTLLGAASGALIGSGLENSDAGQGAIIGAAAGLILGGAAEYMAKREDKRVIAAQNPEPIAQTASSMVQTSDVRPQAQDDRAQITSRPSASSTYFWTPRPQIANAPRVPDAPTY